MRRLYLFRWVRVVSLRHPVPFFAVLFATLYLLQLMLTKIPFVNNVLTFLGTMVSTEYGAFSMHSQGRTLLEAALWIAFADTLNILLDALIVHWLLHWRWARYVLDALSKRGKAFIRDLKKVTRHVVPPSKGTTDNFTRLKNHLNGYAADPRKAGKRVLFVLGTIPRIPGLPGGVGIGILVIKYNKFGFAGWLSLLSGIAFRHCVTLAVVYGIGPFFG